MEQGAKNKEQKAKEPRLRSDVRRRRSRSFGGQASNKKDPNSKFQITKYEKPKGALEILVDLIITDNEAETLQTALNQLGYNDVEVRRFTHWEIVAENQSEKLIDELIKSGELLNTNKEIVVKEAKKQRSKEAIHKLLVRYGDDFTGQGKLATLNNRLGLKEIKSVKKGVLWEIECNEDDWQRILESNILFNPFSQEALLYHGYITD